MKATEQYFHVVLFIMLYKVCLNVKSLDETLVCDYSNESYRVVLSCGIVVIVPYGLLNTFLGNVYFAQQCSVKFVDESHA